MDDHHRSWRPVTMLLIGSFLLSAAVATTALPADAGASGTVELVSQTPWSQPNGRYDVEVVVDGPAGATVELTVHPAVSSRSEYRFSIDSGPRGLPLLTRLPTPADDGGVVSFSIPLTSDPRPGRLTLPDPGVYPVEISLLDIDGTRIDRLTTHIVRVPAQLDGEIPLAVGMTLPIDTGVSLQTDGGQVLSPVDRGAVESLTSALLSAPDVPLSLSLSPETLAAVDGRLAGDLRAAMANRLLLARPFIDIDATAWLDAGLDSEYIDALAVGLGNSSDVLATMPDTTIWAARPTLTTTTLGTLGGLGYQQFVLTEDQLEPLDADLFPLTLTQQFVIEDDNGRRYPAAAIDAELSERFPRGVDPELEAHHLLAELAVLYFDQPSLSRGVIVGPPADWQPDASFLRIILDGLTDNPILRPVSLDTWFTDVSIAYQGGQAASLGFNLTRVLAPTPAIDLSAFSRRYTRTAADVFSYGSVVGPEDPTMSSLNDLLLVAGSEDLTVSQSDDYLAAVATAVRATTDSIVVLEPPERVTFAARNGAVPLVIENSLDREVTLLIAMSSDKLEFPDGADRVVVLEPGTNEVSLEVATRTSGDSVLDLGFSSPDRAIDLGSTSVTVRSTALSGVGMIIAALALTFLLIWWVRTRRTRRSDPNPIVVHDEEPGNVRSPQEV